jgi:hypothetical protein
MNRLLEKNPASPKKSRHPARATANEAALKRDEPAGKVCSKWVEISPLQRYLGGQWPAQDSETPFRMEWRFVCLNWEFFSSAGEPVFSYPKSLLASRGASL